MDETISEKLTIKKLFVEIRLSRIMCKKLATSRKKLSCHKKLKKYRKNHQLIYRKIYRRFTNGVQLKNATIFPNKNKEYFF